MAQLDERTRRDLARLRDRSAPSVAAKQRMYAGLEAQLGPGGGGDDPGGDPSSGPIGDGGAGGIAWAAKVVGATAGLTVGGLVALRVGVEIVRALTAVPSVEVSQEHAPEQSVELASAPDSNEIELVAPTAAPINESPSRPMRRSSVAAPSQPAPVQSDTLAAELALLEAAHAAPDPAAALLELERHLARFPRGELANERDLLRVQTLCRLDRLADARELSERFLLEQPNAGLRRRLASACPAIAESQKN